MGTYRQPIVLPGDASSSDNHGRSPDWTDPSMELINGDRRDDHRYAVELDLEYRITGPGSHGECGLGKTIDIGRGGICYEGQHHLRAGDMAELLVDWPFLLQNRCPLRLILSGKVIWSDEGRCAVSISRYEFQTCGPRFQAASPVDTGRCFVV
jgi:hypothetical protein